MLFYILYKVKNKKHLNYKYINEISKLVTKGNQVPQKVSTWFPFLLLSSIRSFSFMK